MSRKLAAIFLALIAAPMAQADPGKPVAVRWWGQGMVSIETYWNLCVVIDPYSQTIDGPNPRLRADLLLATHDFSDHEQAGIVDGDPFVATALDENGTLRPIHHMLDRPPNSDKIQWRNYQRWIEREPHAIEVTSIPSGSDDEQRGERHANLMWLIEVDGVRIAHCGRLGEAHLTDEQLAALGRVDLLMIPIGAKYMLDVRQAAAVVQQLKPRRVVPIHYDSGDSTHQADELEPFLKALPSDHEVLRAQGNTVAIRSLDDRESVRPQVVVLAQRPWAMPSELAELFAAKEAASTATQAVFAPLNANQMNHRPGDGTHTPRWNAEHMMGRELGFFSEIYASLDPELVQIDLNPAQMPADYVAAHADWTGAEEARQIDRVTDFTRRFSYLLDGVDLDRPAPGSRWTLRRLLEQMERHYGEHTANVKKKFALPDWPAE